MSLHTVPRASGWSCSIGECKEATAAGVMACGVPWRMPRGTLKASAISEISGNFDKYANFAHCSISNSWQSTIGGNSKPFSGMRDGERFYGREFYPRGSSFLATGGNIAFIGSGIFADGASGISAVVYSKAQFSRIRADKNFVVRAAIFDQLSENLEKVWEKLSKETVLTRENMKEPMKEIRRALLEADVSLPVVRRFVSSVSERAVGTEVVRGVRPDQQLVKVVNDELVLLMGGQLAELQWSKVGPTVILLAGLQGVGKTTACAKLALYLKKKGKKVMMVATDVYRPAAIDQLITLGQQVDVPVFSLGTDVRPEEIARKGLEDGKKKKVDVVLVDTAGRLQIDPDMMSELSSIKSCLSPHLAETLLVVDAMTGQQAALLASSFHLQIGITGAILTKMDGDSRGGAALSVKEVSGQPIKFVGEGEGMTALEPFYPDRMANRILGMGDILTLVERAQEAMAQEDTASLQKKMLEANFDFDDLLKQTKIMASLGSLSGISKFIPGLNKLTPQQIKEGEKSMRVMKSMIDSMTPVERRKPELLAESPSRRRRIAKGSGRTQEQVSALVGQLFSARAQMKKLMAMPQMGLPELDGVKKAAPGKAKRKKTRGFGELLASK